MKSLDDITVSILVPVYNVVDYLPRCIDSLINQTHQNLQIVIVNDASTDGSAAVLKEYANEDKRIILIENESNIGTADCIKILVHKAIGQYSMIVGSDDYLQLNAVECALKAIQADSADYLEFGHTEIHADGRKVVRMSANHKILQTNCFLDLFTSSVWSIAFKCFKTHCLKQAFAEISFFNQRIVRSEDFYFFILFVSMQKDEQR